LPSWLRGKWGSFDPVNGLPAGYIPNQDQGRFYIAVQLPDAAAMERTQHAVDRIQRLVQPMGGVLHTTEIAGQSFTFNANGSNFRQFFISFEDFGKRRELENETWFRLTDASLDPLHEAGVPEGVLSKLRPLKYREFREPEFRAQLGKILAETERQQ